MSFPPSLNLFTTQLIAAGDIGFAANADGVNGGAMVAGGQIDGTSNASMGFCDNGMEANIEAYWFKMVN